MIPKIKSIGLFGALYLMTLVAVASDDVVPDLMAPSSVGTSPGYESPFSKENNADVAKKNASIATSLIPVDSSSVTAPKVVEGVRAKDSDKDLSARSSTDKALDAAFPLSDEDVVKARAREIGVQRAKNLPLFSPSVNVRSVEIHLDPGYKPETLKIARGFDTSLSILDAAGAPWPIEKFSVGSDQFFQATAATPNTITIKAKELYQTSNLTVHLKDIETPIVFFVAYSDDTVDFQVTGIVPKVSPSTSAVQSAIASTQGGGQSVFPPLASSELSGFLDNVAPSGASRLAASGDNETTAWMYQGKLVLRTPFILAYPSVPNKSVLRGGSGYSVYVLSVPVSVVTLIRNGKPYSLSVSIDQRTAGAQ